MVLFHQLKEMQVGQSGSKRRDQHLKLHASKAIQLALSVKQRRSFKADRTLDSQM